MHKQISLLALFLLLSSFVFGQFTLETGPEITIRKHKPGEVQRPKAVLCVPDTVAYPSSKATSLRFLSVNTASSGQSLYQYYDAPQSLTIYGMDFFAFAPNTGDTVQCVAELYLAGADSLPMGAPLASDTIGVDSAAGGFTLTELRHKIIFQQPVTVNQDYILIIQNPNAQSISVVCNDWSTFDGGYEWLSGADFRNAGGNWTRGYDVNVGGTPFNADILLNPYVEYDLSPQFSVDQTCLTPPDSVNFTNYSSPILDNRMYNLAVINASGTEYSWNFGDGSPAVNGRNVGHTYLSAGPFTATLTTTVTGWTNICQANAGVVVGGSGNPTADFIYSQTGANINFTSIASGATSISWDFGDGSAGSTLQNPFHYYSMNGNYPVTLIAQNACGTDTLTDTVSINCDRPVANFSFARSGLLVNFSDSSANATQWSWEFGDGSGFSTIQHPSYVYAGFGTYVVRLIVSSSCGSDTLQDTVVIQDPNSVPEPFQDEFTVFPNPTQGSFQLKGPSGLWNLTVSDPGGRILFRKRLNLLSDQGEIVEFPASLPTGLYFLTIRQEDKVLRKKLLYNR